MRRALCVALTLTVILGMSWGCSQAAPTVVPPKPAAVSTAPTVAPPAGPTSAVPAAPAAKVKRGGILVSASDIILKTLDPIKDPAGADISRLLIFESLVRYDVVDYKAGKSELKPELAESWQQVDPKTVVLKLQKGVKFHDGSNFDAAAAKWSLERMGEDPKSLSKALAANFASLEVVDSYTLKINYKTPSAISVLNLTSATDGTGSVGPLIVSKAQLDKLGEDGFASNPSGTGPMKFDEWKRDQEVSVKKFEGYWRKGADGQPLPYLDGLRDRSIVDATTLVTELKAGSVHVGIRAIQPPDLANIRANQNLEVVLMHWAPYRQSFSFNSKNKLLKDNKNLRLAGQYALDREQMAKTLGLEAGRPNYYMHWVPQWPGYDEKNPRFEFNPEKAKQYMKDAGYPNGIDLELVHTTETLQRRIAEMVQAMWGNVGIRVKPNPMEHITWKQKILTGVYEMSLGGMASSPDPAYAKRVIVCEGVAANNTYCNPEVDKCMLEGEQVLDVNQRAEIYKRCQRLIFEDAELGSTYMSDQIMVYNKSVKGILLQQFNAWFDEAWIDK